MWGWILFPLTYQCLFSFLYLTNHILFIRFSPIPGRTSPLLLISMSGLKCSVCNYNTSDTISNDSDITSKIKVLEIHSLATHQGVNQQGNAGGELNQQTSYKQDNTRVQLEQQVGCRQGNGIEELDQQNWINQSFPESNLVPILTVPNDATPIYNVNIPPPGSSNNEFE